MSLKYLAPADHDLLKKIRTAVPENIKVYLTGGAVRDFLCGRAPHDFDFVIAPEAKVIPLARRIANAMEADFYPMDVERDTARAILTSSSGKRLFLDFAAQRGADLYADLTLRDFTINAIALDLDQPDQLIDPLGGARDIFEKNLRACSETSLSDDPIRTLRGIRMALNYQLKILPDTRLWTRQNINRISETSAERQRDEIYHLLECAKPDAAIRALDTMDALPVVFPELVNLKNVQQAPPHIQDVWSHTLSVVRDLQQVLQILRPETDLENHGNINSGWISLRLGRFRQNITEHFSNQLNPDRSMSGLLNLAALYHDAGKAAKKTITPQGQIHFYHHEEESKELVVQRARALHLSNLEIERVSAIVAGHMRPFSLASSEAPLSKRAIYRFWRDLDVAGVDVCLLSLADLLGTFGATLQQEQLIAHLDVLRTLLEAWWEHRSERVNPPVLVDGHQIMEVFGLKPGPAVGRVLEVVREAQATGEVSNFDQAIKYAQEWLKSSPL